LQAPGLTAPPDQQRTASGSRARSLASTIDSCSVHAIGRAVSRGSVNSIVETKNGLPGWKRSMPSHPVELWTAPPGSVQSAVIRPRASWIVRTSSASTAMSR
jgi:hypothetical protein